MALPRALLAALLAVLLPAQALAQGPQAPEAVDDALLAPLTPAEPAAPRKAPRRSAPVVEDALLAPLVAKPTALRVRLPPALTGARLQVDGEDRGALPGADVAVRPGTHHVRVWRAGYRDYSTRVYTPEGRVTEVGAQLVALAGAPAVVARAQPGGTDRPLASAEASEASEASGAPGAPVALAVPAPSEPAASALAPLPAFSPPAPWFKRWYVWAGVGAVATAAVVGTVAATRSAGTAQPFSPGEVCGGSCDGVLGASRSPAR